MKRFLQPTLFLLLIVVGASACNELTEIQKSTDVMEKYSYAKKFYNTGKYSWAAQLLEEVVPYLEGTRHGEQALYLQGQTYYHLEQYSDAMHSFQKYYMRFPNGEYSELARFYAGYGLAQQMPDPRLDQARTYEAMNELRLFLDYYPESEKADEAKQMLFALQENLALKELYNVELYYNLGNYIFNNYESCVIVARNAMKDYPYSIHKEEIHYYVVASLYQMARYSVVDKQQQRLRDLRDECYNYFNEYPEGKHKRKVEEHLNYAEKYISEDAV